MRACKSVAVHPFSCLRARPQAPCPHYTAVMACPAGSLRVRLGTKSYEVSATDVARSALLGRCVELGGENGERPSVRLGLARAPFEAWLHGRVFKSGSPNLKVFKVRLVPARR